MKLPKYIKHINEGSKPLKGFVVTWSQQKLRDRSDLIITIKSLYQL